LLETAVTYMGNENGYMIGRAVMGRRSALQIVTHSTKVPKVLVGPAAGLARAEWLYLKPDENLGERTKTPQIPDR